MQSFNNWLSIKHPEFILDENLGKWIAPTLMSLGAMQSANAANYNVNTSQYHNAGQAVSNKVIPKDAVAISSYQKLENKITIATNSVKTIVGVHNVYIEVIKQQKNQFNLQQANSRVGSEIQNNRQMNLAWQAANALHPDFMKAKTEYVLSVDISLEANDEQDALQKARNIIRRALTQQGFDVELANVNMDVTKENIQQIFRINLKVKVAI